MPKTLPFRFALGGLLALVPPALGAPSPASPALGAPVVVSRALLSPAPQVPPPSQVPSAPVRVDETFRHDRHAAFGCRDCHAMQVGHGTLVVTTPSDCQSCHHAPPQLQDGCALCHQPEELRNIVGPQVRNFSLSVLDAPEQRHVDFSHEVHAGRACVECHTGPPPPLSAAEVDCSGCHQEHHQPDNVGCAQCHRPAARDAHTLDVHQTCAGSGCHLDPPFEGPPPTRPGCLWCHEEQADHEPQGVCVDCHVVSATVGGPVGFQATSRGPTVEISPRGIGRISRLRVHFHRRYLLAESGPRS